MSRLDGELEEAKKHVELARRREDLDRHARQLRDQWEALQKRRTLALQLGRADLVDRVEPPLAALNKELNDVRTALGAFGAAPPGEEALKQALGTPRADLPSTAVDSILRTDAMGLIDEIEAGKMTLADWTHEERGAQLRVWALRWRSLAERIGQSIARNDPVMRKAYAVIMETRERFPGLPFIEALDPRRHGDWERELEVAKRELPLVRERVKRHREAEAQLDRVRSVPARYRLPDDAEGMKALREAARPLLGIPHVRATLGGLLKPWRAALPDEFGVLWREDAANREIVSQSKPGGAA